MRPQGAANTRPLDVAEHVDKVQVRRHKGLQGTACHLRHDSAPPMTQGLARSQQVHVQRLGAETDVVLVRELLGIGRAKKFSHVDWRRLAVFFLRCQQTRVRVSHLAVGGSEPVESLLKKAARAARTLLACTLRDTFNRSVMCSGRVPVRPGAVRGAWCRPAKGLSQSSSGGAEGHRRPVLPERRRGGVP